VRGDFYKILAVSLALVASANFAQATDLPGTAVAPSAASLTPPAQPAAFDWTGFYVGGHGGFGVDHYAFKYAVDVPGAAFTGTDGITAVGPVLGLQAGFNYQIPIGFLPGGFVVGVEIDNSWTGIHGATTGSGVPASGLGTITFGGRFLNVGTARLRLGYAYDRFLFYVTGGFAYGISKAYYQLDTNAGFQSFGSHTSTRSGVPGHVGSIGFGVEYAMTPNWTVRAEYFYDGINAHYELYNPTPGASVGFGTRTMFHVGRIGLNYKFDWPAPVAVLK
jgi:outer membrane immunogenic protein